MPLLGERTYWTEERENALLKLGKAGTLKTRAHIDWEHASATLPNERKLLKEKTNSQLSKMYLKIIKSKNKKCASSKCNHTVVDDARYCKFHRHVYSTNANLNKPSVEYSSSYINEHKTEIVKALNTYSKQELITFIFEHISKIKIENRKHFIERVLKKEN